MTLPLRATRHLLPLAAVLTLAGGGAALAQPGQPYGAPPRGQGYGGPPGQQQGGEAQSELASLHAALHITAAQEGAWQAFAAASRPDLEAQARERAAQQMLPTLTGPQRVELSIAAMEADLDTLRRHGAALKAFYATLSPAQQTTFDRETLPRDEDR